MKRCNCPDAIVKKIKVRDRYIPVRGLEPIMFLVANLKLKDETEIVKKLMCEIRKLENTIPADFELEFQNYLLDEYKSFVNKINLNRTKRILKNN
jgi:hypothetical protein